MTNEEKSMEAARVIKEEIGMSEHSIPRVAEIIDWCLTWKGQQFKEYLEKKKSEYDKDYSIAIANNDDYVVGKTYGRFEAVNEIINEHFKEY